MGVAVEVKLTIRATYVASFDFTMHGSPYTFLVTKWSSRGFAKFATLFFNATTWDPTKFGTFSEADDGTVSFSMDTSKKLNMVEQGVKDILSCIDLIGCHYQRSVRDYAVWYREKHPELDTYVQYITRAACCAIAHVDFLAPNITWDLVQFLLS
ncbi:hypothetical protein CHLRE_15g640550v5 [Chlamydomonas reinhardtii]|uniref:Uncharacterized protein n=1 Tax=Chlamydomonas reinhardtii TaxID=3055 RepID=A8JED0_CHLRE|nr:uncharacterized protein CHLRE_15g640550v5 [Chlamydomonas reinhardtii]PNW72677.1 hypothetical protein CHLRE_15g640550v5 [Chlamydomonas reinhardtii]|eukprot:XP_001701138.1 predicted protein [Chlamydomonas reinhardtii]